MLASSFNILFSFAGQVSMAHAAFYGFGAYSAGRLSMPIVKDLAVGGVLPGLGFPLAISIVIAMIFAFFLAFIIALPALSRVTGDYLILLTLAFQMITNQLMSALDGVTGGSYGLKSVPPLTFFGNKLTQPIDAIWFFLVVTSLVLYLCHFISASPYGRLLRGIREQDSAVRAVGKSSSLPKIMAFGFAGAIAAMVGGLNGAYYQLVVPNTFSLNLSILVFSVVVLGGAGNLIGTVLVAFILTALRPVIQAIAGDSAIAWQAVIYGFALILIARFRPEGLLPEGYGPRKIIKKFRSTGNLLPSAEIEQVVTEPSISFNVRQTVINGASLVAEPILVIKNLTKSFGGVKAVQGVSFNLMPNRITGLVGPNGAGKTTVFNLITRSIIPDTGTVFLNGREISNLSTVQIAKSGIARSFQDGRLFMQLSAIDNVSMAVPNQLGESIIGLVFRPIPSMKRERIVRNKAVEALHYVGLRGNLDELVGNKSYGDQKLVAIARLIATECDLLLLDEPTAGVDPSAVEKVIGAVLDLRRLGKTICLVEHSINMMGQLAEHILFMDQGRVIAEGALDTLMRDKNLTEIYFGT
jgi:branched-chain amino acid transport system permease protein